MKARILVLAVNDGDEYIELACIADEFVMDANERYLPEQVEKARKDFGKSLEAHGFIDVEIPDDVIAQVLRRHADAGVVAAEAVSEARS
jgi:hypothetical protein